MIDIPIVKLLNPGQVVFGQNCLQQFAADFQEKGLKKLFILSIEGLEQLLPLEKQLGNAGISVEINYTIKSEPTFQQFEDVLEEARRFGADSVAGIGGGSVMDTAKLVAAQLLNQQSVSEITGIGRLKERQTYLACIPTTAGTGSEVSPNAIFVDEGGNKVGVISPFLVPDASYVDPLLTVSVPKAITAATGIDALAHCLEAYTNRFAHPVVDLIALEGVRLIASHLRRACDNGADLDARGKVALGSMYGGMCLGPVNTAAAHALAYPLGTDFHVSHGLSVSLLLPSVMEFTMEGNPDKHAKLALALGAEKKDTDLETAREGVLKLRQLIADCGLPSSLSELGIPESAIEGMARDAMKVQRLLKNSIREVNQAEAEAIYRSAF